MQNRQLTFKAEQAIKILSGAVSTLNVTSLLCSALAETASRIKKIAQVTKVAHPELCCRKERALNFGCQTGLLGNAWAHD
jgi:hypothetical protein